LATKRRLFDRAAADRALVHAFHFPSRGWATSPQRAPVGSGSQPMGQASLAHGDPTPNPRLDTGVLRWRAADQVGMRGSSETRKRSRVSWASLMLPQLW
jgi:hypothetical protein